MKELIEIQNKLNAPKNQRNNFGNYNYRSCEDILEGLKDLLLAQKCYVTLSNDIKIVADRIYVVSTATIFNSEKETVKAQAMAREPKTQKGMSDAQLTGATISYANKYALNNLFAIDDSKDSDDNSNHDNYQPQNLTNQQQPQNQSNNDNKPWLNEDTENWENVSKWILEESGDINILINQVANKYKISKPNREKLKALK